MSQIQFEWDTATEVRVPKTVVRGYRGPIPPRRTARFEDEPGFYEDGGLWLYGNVKLLQASLACVPEVFGPDVLSPKELDRIEGKAERIVFESKVLVCGIHNQAHQKAAIVPLRWGSPRIVIFSGGFKHHLGENLDQEPFRAARLWRYQWDPKTDLAISRRAPDKLPTFASLNPTVDRVIQMIVNREWSGLLFRNPKRPFR
jgi:DNA processing protein